MRALALDQAAAAGGLSKAAGGLAVAPGGQHSEGMATAISQSHGQPRHGHGLASDFFSRNCNIHREKERGLKDQFKNKYMYLDEKRD